MVSLIPYGISFVLLVLILEIASYHRHEKPKLMDLISVSFFTSILVLFFDVFAGKAPDYALLIFAFIISTGVFFCYWKQGGLRVPLILGFTYTIVWLSMQLWITLIVSTILIIAVFAYHIKRKDTFLST